MAVELAPGINMPDGLSEQPPRADQEDDGEHEQAWNEQKISASQVVYHVKHLNERDQHHEPGQHPPGPRCQEQKIGRAHV